MKKSCRFSVSTFFAFDRKRASTALIAPTEVFSRLVMVSKVPFLEGDLQGFCALYPLKAESNHSRIGWLLCFEKKSFAIMRSRCCADKESNLLDIVTVFAQRLTYYRQLL